MLSVAGDASASARRGPRTAPARAACSEPAPSAAACRRAPSSRREPAERPAAVRVDGRRHRDSLPRSRANAARAIRPPRPRSPSRAPIEHRSDQDRGESFDLTLGSLPPIAARPARPARPPARRQLPSTSAPRACSSESLPAPRRLVSRPIGVRTPTPLRAAEPTPIARPVVTLSSSRSPIRDVSPAGPRPSRRGE